MADDVAATYGPEPTAFLSANQDELVLSGERGTHRWRRDHVRAIAGGRMYPWFWRGIRIQPVDAKLPEVQFKPEGVSRAEIRERLRQLGYPVR